MSSRGQLSRGISGHDVVVLVCAVLFLLGLIIGFIGNSQRKKVQRALLVAQRREAGAPGYSVNDIGIVRQLSSELEPLSEQGQATDGSSKYDSATIVSGIELSAAIQSYLHEYRQRFESESILLDDRNLGFSDYIREVAVVTEPVKLRLLQLQLDELRTLLNAVIESQPTALVSVKRNVETIQNPGTEQVNPQTGLLEVSELTYRHQITISLEFDGYTRSLRDFLNTRLDGEHRFKVVSLKVTRSPRSENDRTSQLMEGVSEQVSNAKKKAKPDSPFEAYFEPEETRVISGETQPLIGEVVSRFKIVLERGVEG